MDYGTAMDMVNDLEVATLYATSVRRAYTHGLMTREEWRDAQRASDHTVGERRWALIEALVNGR